MGPEFLVISFFFVGIPSVEIFVGNYATSKEQSAEGLTVIYIPFPLFTEKLQV